MKTKYEKIMDGAGIWLSFYRANPHRLAKEYLGMYWLRPFQQILLNIIIKFTYSMIIASRGMGKSQIVAAAIVVKCILYPGIKVVIAAGNRGQSLNVVNKIIEEFMPNSPNLRFEIENYKATPSEAYIKFKNGSIIKVVTARDSARSARANWVVNDEFVQIKKSVIDTVLRKFKAGQRTPDFYNNPKYKNYPKEPNTETYISSAYYKSHYSWDKFLSFFKSLLKGESYICLGFPYQLPVSEGYYPEEQIREEMQEADFDPITWSMEMDSLFFGEAQDAFFSFDSMQSNRNLMIPTYPRPYYHMLKDSKLKYKMKQNGEIRIIAMDIAVMGGKKNDNTAYTLMQLIPTNSYQYQREITYIEALNGGHTFDQAIKLRQLYDDFDADYVVVDTNGVGIAVYDNLVKEIYDENRDKIYEPWTCINDSSMAERCKDKNAPAIIYSIKATTEFNNDCAVNFRDCLRRGKLKLLCSDIDASGALFNNKTFHDLTPEELVMFKSPFVQTTLLVNETINLSYKTINGKIKLSESSGRKDRYSSASYANMIASELERDLKPGGKRKHSSHFFVMKKPKI